jgi:hypothetical protein
MNPTLRVKILSGIALAIIAYIVFANDEPQTVEPAQDGRRAADSKAVPARREVAPAADHRPRSLLASLHASDRLVKDTVAGALFASHSWYVAPPQPPPGPPPAPVAPPPPVAPPLPFAFMGSYKSQDGNPTFFLTAGDRVYDVKVGDTLDNTYSVDGVKSGQLFLTYIPLKIQQALAVGDE